MNSWLKVCLSLEDLMSMLEIDEKVKEKLHQYVYLMKCSDDQTGELHPLSFCDEGKYWIADYTHDDYVHTSRQYYRWQGVSEKGIEFLMDHELTRSMIMENDIRRMLRAYDSLRMHPQIREYEYRYIKAVPPLFYIHDEAMVKEIVRCSENAVYSKRNSYINIFDLLHGLGEYNIYGAGDFMQEGKMFLRYQRNSRIDQLCNTLIRECTKLSDCLYLYANTHLKRYISLEEYLSLCMEEDVVLDYDDFEIDIHCIADSDADGNVVLRDIMIDQNRNLSQKLAVPAGKRMHVVVRIILKDRQYNCEYTIAGNVDGIPV